MGLDDSGTLAALKAHRRELIDPKIAEYDGRIVKTTGDGLLLEFPSVVDAVRCAVDVQRGMAERNEGIAPDKRLDFRIGINVGDIIIDGDDIFGDGVNVAARLEALADPGGICVSRVVRDQVLDKLSFAFEDLGRAGGQEHRPSGRCFPGGLGERSTASAQRSAQALAASDTRTRTAVARRGLTRRRLCGRRGLGVAAALDSATAAESTRAVGCASCRWPRQPDDADASRFAEALTRYLLTGLPTKRRIRSRGCRFCRSRCECRHAAPLTHMNWVANSMFATCWKATCCAAARRMP